MQSFYNFKVLKFSSKIRQYYIAAKNFKNVQLRQKHKKN